MNWLVWKQHRKLFVTFAGIMVLYAALAIPMGLHAWHMYQHALATCGRADSCSQLSHNLVWTGWTSTIDPNSGHGIGLLLLLPFLLGVFVGVPLITREYNEKTNLLVWTRSISRRKWLTTKLVWILAATALFAGTLTVLATWWSRAGNALYLNRFELQMFDTQGIAPIGFAVLAVSIGIALGAWLKRIMAAIGLTFVLVLAVQIVIDNHLRPYYMKPLTQDTVTSQLGPGGDTEQAPKGAWIFSSKIENNAGQTLSWTNPPARCVVTRTDSSSNSRTNLTSATDQILSINGGSEVDTNCLVSAGYHYVTKYQPAYRYWDFQRIELGLYLALSAVPIGATYWLILRRDA